MAEPTDDRTPIRVWTGTGLCAESQGDGVPCTGTDGTCDTCGRALAGQITTDHRKLGTEELGN